LFIHTDLYVMNSLYSTLCVQARITTTTPSLLSRTLKYTHVPITAELFQSFEA